MYFWARFAVLLSVLLAAALVGPKIDGKISGSWYGVLSPFYVSALACIGVAVYNGYRNWVDGTWVAWAHDAMDRINGVPVGMGRVNAYAALGGPGAKGSPSRASEERARRLKLEEDAAILKGGYPMFRFDDDLTPGAHRPALRYLVTGVFLVLQVSLFSAALEKDIRKRDDDAYVLALLPTLFFMLGCVFYTAVMFFRTQELSSRNESRAAMLRKFEGVRSDAPEDEEAWEEGGEREGADRRSASPSDRSPSRRPGRRSASPFSAPAAPASIPVARETASAVEEEAGGSEEDDLFLAQETAESLSEQDRIDLEDEEARRELARRTAVQLLRCETARVKYAFLFALTLLLMVSLVFAGLNGGERPSRRWSWAAVAILVWIAEALWLAYLVYVEVRSRRGTLAYRFPPEDQAALWVDWLAFVVLLALAVARADGDDFPASVVFVPVYAWFLLRTVLLIVGYARKMRRATASDRGSSREG